MNIDTSGLLNLLSSTENIENIQQLLPATEVEGQAFADTFQETINQLNHLTKKIQQTENFSARQQENTDQILHGIADLLQARGKIDNLSVQSGKQLPGSNIVNQDINLNTSLESLANAMTQLDEMADSGEDLTSRVKDLVQTVKGLKATIPDHKQLQQSLNDIVENLHELKQQTPELKTFQVNEDLDFAAISEELEQLNSQLDQQLSLSEDQVIENIQKPAQLENLSDSVPDKAEFEPAPEILPAATELTETIDNITESISQIKEVLFNDSESAGPDINSLENEIETLATEVEVFQNFLHQKEANGPEHKMTDKTSANPLELQSIDLKEEQDHENLDQQITEIITTLEQPTEQKRIISESQIIGQAIQELMPENKKENILLRQIADEKTLSIANKTETNSLLQQENGLDKLVHEKPVILAKQYDKETFFGDLEFDLGNEKVLPKIATDLGMLNRAVNQDNNVELPPMTKHFAHPEWNKEMGEKIIWMHKQEIPSAELRLNPKHLGPVTIKVDVTKDQATVAFTAQHAAVKEAIDSAIPKLKEMFSAQQLNLVDVNVSQDTPDQRQSRSFNQMGNDSGNSNQNRDNEQAENRQSAESVMDVNEEIEAGRAIASNGILSIFA